jgi:hypothetical protein
MRQQTARRLIKNHCHAHVAHPFIGASGGVPWSRGFKKPYRLRHATSDHCLIDPIRSDQSAARASERSTVLGTGSCAPRGQPHALLRPQIDPSIWVSMS